MLRHIASRKFLNQQLTTVALLDSLRPHTEVPAPERHELFLQKLHQCAVVFDFNDVSTDIGGKQIKAATLAEMLEWITTQRGVITEAVYPEVVAMVSGGVEAEVLGAGTDRSSTDRRDNSLRPTCSGLFRHR